MHCIVLLFMNWLWVYATTATNDQPFYKRGSPKQKYILSFLFTDATLYEKLKPFHVNIVAS